DQSAVNDVPAQTLPELPPAVEQAPVADVAAVKPNIAETKINTTVTEPTAKTSAVQAPTVQAPTVQAGEFFTVQVGVYSDAANVKRLQEQLKQAGFVTKTEKIKTAKGESIRLRAGSYPSRQDATLALAKIKDLGLPGMVVSQ
ncbi:MAG: SPOR domain-containing protein, partial [Methylotenera sp.]